MSYKKNKKKFYNKNNNTNSITQKKAPFHTEYKPDPVVEAQNQEAIRMYKENVKTCVHCSKPINDLTSAFRDKNSDGAVHFDCVLTRLQEIEKLEANQKISYIGQGKFAVVHFENPHDLRNFSIVRTIEWENHDAECEWRDSISGLYSTIH